MIAPTLTTERLILRAHRVEDHAACAGMWGDPQVTRHIGKPESPQAAWFRILRYAGSWTLLGYGFWAITDLDGQYLGEGGFGDFRREIAALDGVPEIGWALMPAAWGRGVASEAVAAMLDWSDINIAVEDVRCLISKDNAASVQVAIRNGFAAVAKLDDGAQVFSRQRR